MLVPRSLSRDLFALVLCALTVFLTLALFTYSAADPVGEVLQPLGNLYQHDVLVYPQNEQIHNACGRWGALAADLLLTGLGLGAFYFLFSLALLAVTLLRRQAIDAPVLRTVGWLVSLVGLTTLIAIVTPGLSPGPVIGPGGYLGALGRGFVHAHFATAGGIILSLSCVMGGWLLCADHLVVRAASLLLTAGVLLVFQSRQVMLPWQRKGAFAGVGGDAAEGMTVKVRGRAKKASDLDTPKAGSLKADASKAKIALAKLADEDEPDLIDDDELNEADEMEEDEEEVLPVVSRKNSAAVGNTALAEKPGTERSTVTSAPHFKIRRPGDGLDRAQVLAELDQASQADGAQEYELPSLELLIPSEDFNHTAQEEEVRRKAKILEKTFEDFGFKVKVVEIETGPVIAQYEVELEAGLRLSKITGLADDLAIALRVPSVRIVAPIPGKNTVGIEVPNEDRQVVRLREVIEETDGKTKKMRIPLFLGKDVAGNALTVDLSTLPHLLIAGRTGTGKSVCLNAIITSILMTRRPDEVRMLMIDPKMVELSGYARLPHLMHPVVTDMKKAEAILAWAVEKMEERYSLLARAGVRHISSYNQLGEAELMDRLQPEDDEGRKAIPLHLPFIVIVADEIADMMMTAGKEVEQHIIRLAQKSRAVGIHLILATQKPTVDVITGLIKSNLPARISFQVASRVDSRVVLDEMGADKLLGNGDMLFLWPGTSTLLRGQGTYLGDDEINKVVDWCGRSGEQNFVSELVNLKVEEGEGGKGIEQIRKRDELYESAIDVVVREGRGSVSLLQRTLGVGYGRAARLIDFMAEDNIVGQYAGSQAREVLITLADWERMQGQEVTDDESAEPPAKSKRPNRVTPEASMIIPEKPSMVLLPTNSRKPVQVPPWSEEDSEVDEEENEMHDDGEESDHDPSLEQEDHEAFEDGDTATSARRPKPKDDDGDDYDDYDAESA